MRAIVYDRDARSGGLSELPVPEPAGAGEVLFRPSYAAICGSDLHLFQGSEGYGWVRSPLVLGHEAVGTLPGEAGLYLLNPYIPCGACRMCRTGHTSTCMGPDGGRAKESPPWSLQYGFRRHGGMAEAMTVERSSLVPVPPGLPPRLAALAESVAVGRHGVEAGARLLGGAAAETAAVLGPGPIGLGAAFVLAARGIRTAVLGLPRDAERLRRARSLGAAASTDEARALEAAIDGWTQGTGADLVIEATGTEAAWETAIGLVRRGGVIVSLGIPLGRVSLKLREVVRGGVVVTGSYGVTLADLTATLAFLAAHAEQGMALVGRSFPLAEGEAAFRHASRSAGKVLLAVGAEGAGDA
jgi:threonine dehydrogenase-like Zn-dependent dehydrogenase